MAAAVVLLATLAFCRDFERKIPEDLHVLLAPADGKVTDICEMEESEFIKGPVLRIGVFLSVFDVHVNRTPCSGQVGYRREHPGKCLNAMRSAVASAQNRAISLGLDCPDHPAGKILVRQISGAIARRIVCACQIGDNLVAGQRYGMIKFGSRTELFLPLDRQATILVEPGQCVRAGSTLMIRYPPSGQEPR